MDILVGIFLQVKGQKDKILKNTLEWEIVLHNVIFRKRIFMFHGE